MLKSRRLAKNSTVSTVWTVHFLGRWSRSYANADGLVGWKLSSAAVIGDVIHFGRNLQIAGYEPTGAVVSHSIVDRLQRLTELEAGQFCERQQLGVELDSGILATIRLWRSVRVHGEHRSDPDIGTEWESGSILACARYRPNSDNVHLQAASLLPRRSGVRR